MTVVSYGGEAKVERHDKAVLAGGDKFPVRMAPEAGE